MVDMAGMQAFGEQGLDWLADQIGPIVAKHALGLAVGDHDLAMLINNHDRVGRGLQERLELGIGGREHRCGVLMHGCGLVAGAEWMLPRERGTQVIVHCSSPLMGPPDIRHYRSLAKWSAGYLCNSTWRDSSKLANEVWHGSHILSTRFLRGVHASRRGADSRDG